MLPEGENYNLSPTFLMDMMELNEAVAELPPTNGETQKNALWQQVNQRLTDLDEQIQPTMQQFKPDASQPQKELLAIKDYYYKKRYLLRIFANLKK